MEVLSLILGGGKGTRLYPLTKQRSKPAVPFGGKYRLVDIPISNCINSGFREIYILTQFNSASLHVHVNHTYVFDSFSRGFVEILAAEQTFEHSSFYEGTADAVRKNFSHFHTHNPENYLILSGDQLFRMDLQDFYRTHKNNAADISLSCTPVTKEKTLDLGILKVDEEGRVIGFIEKPSLDKDISEYKMPRNLHPDQEAYEKGECYLASMGMYFFKASAMEHSLDNNKPDFGKNIIPDSIDHMKVQSYIYTGFWEDIGTIKNFYQNNINLSSVNPAFNFYDEKMPIYTHRRDLPASKINFCTISQTLTADGCIITNASIANSIIGIRTLIDSGSNLDGVICMGADFYETMDQKNQNKRQGVPNIGIGKGTIVKKAIIDKNVRIGENCRIGIDNINRKEGDYGNYHIKDDVIVIHKGAVLPEGSII
ncbi:glucose-1-phosphate adenylyltransferase [Spirochaeta cellobiosiphila]|uniref:glucose-1-phosphate adenylyltransferase n=1 Tax=Spirochaeta cellobiosiphila TaxID=504483 RepID=UPI00040DEED9|nr:glucose-1-phosphate adenylyltransferase [Spirochaeta cellobiosiphila]